MPQKDYVAEAEIRTAAANAGVLAGAIEDFILDFESYKFGRDEIAKYIDECKTTKPHRFAVQSNDDALLFNQAFGAAPNLTAQTRVVKQFGLERAKEVAAMFGTSLGSAKPGTAPDGMKPATPAGGERNPWSSQYADPKTGRYSARAITLQANLVKAIGFQKASEIARAAGARIGDVRPPKAA